MLASLCTKAAASLIAMHVMYSPTIYPYTSDNVLGMATPSSTKYFGLLILLCQLYTQEEIAKAKGSPSFEREYNLKCLGLIGNVFHIKVIDAAIEKGTKYNPPANVDQVNHYT